MYIDTMKEAMQIREEILANRRALHQIPEIGLELPQTVAFVTEKLEQMGIHYRVYRDCSCITATIGKGGKCILLRADMDALPVAEQSGLCFASTNGNMHACGHDCHTAALLGAARILKTHESELKGTVKLIFQAGEEIFKGASAAIAHGVMEDPKVDAAFATHVFAAMPCGSVAYGKNTMASVYGFRIRVQGKGTHGSAPEMGIDPIAVGANIVMALQEIIAREIAPSQKAVLTIGHFEGGSAANIIPDYAILEGTLRTFDRELRGYLLTRITEVAESVAKAYRAAVTVETLSDVPSVVCDDAMTELTIRCAKAVKADVTLVPGLHTMGSEDFAFYGQQVPSVIVGIGAGVADPARWVGQHNPRILFHEDALPLEAALYAKVAETWLEENP